MILSAAQANIQLRTVGLLPRDPGQEYPLRYLEEVFDKVGVRLHRLDQEAPPPGLDLVLALGGDGTVLKALDLEPGCPVLAINYGSVGFLTAGDPEHLERMINCLLAGEYMISERLMLRCEHPGGVASVVNEVALRANWRMVYVDVEINGARIRTIRGDGVIVGTPTGSTGYLLSTGGPIVMPDAECFVLDGINEYNFTSRALILPASATVRLRLGDLLPDQSVHVYVDGRMLCPLESGQEVVLSRSPKTAQLIFFEEDYFFRNLAGRLSWQ